MSNDDIRNIWFDPDEPEIVEPDLAKFQNDPVRYNTLVAELLSRGIQEPLGGGNVGPKGDQGFSIFSDPGAPSALLGLDGDLYIDSANGDLYEKISGVWIVEGNLTGPQGIQGQQGIQGPQGDPAPVETFNILIGDWFSTDAGETFSIDITHTLNTVNVTVDIYEGNQIVWAEDVLVLDVNTVRIKVSQAEVDARFNGTIKHLVS